MVKKPDLEKLEKIREVLKQAKDGLWIREIARLSGISKSTVSYYINKYMKDEIEDVWKKGFIRVVRLREWKKSL
jgi:predicted transcriptional regulator